MHRAVARLAFKKAFIEPILDGRKTSTLRAQTRLAEGDEVDLACQWGLPPFARARVTRVSEVRREDFSEELARAEGFRSLEEFTDVIDQLYPEVVSFVRIDFAPSDP